MKRNFKILLIIIICITILTIVLIYQKNNNKQKEFMLDDTFKYIITTDEQFSTLQNDGGSHINTYYQIDLKDNVVTKCQDKYVGFQGYEYKGKIIYSKILSEESSNDLKLLLSDVIKNKDLEKDLSLSNYKYYTISTKDYKDIKLNDYTVIKEIENLIEK